MNNNKLSSSQLAVVVGLLLQVENICNDDDDEDVNVDVDDDDVSSDEDVKLAMFTVTNIKQIALQFTMYRKTHTLTHTLPIQHSSPLHMYVNG